MRFMGWDRIVLWWILAISSLPIHLLYNSVAFETTGGNLYITAAVSSAFIDSGNRKFFSPDGSGAEFDFTNFKNISNSDCIQQYSAAQEDVVAEMSYLANTGSVVAVSSDIHLPNDVIFAYGSSSDDILWAGNFTTSTQNFWSFFNSSNWISSFNPITFENIPLALLWVCRDLLTPGFEGNVLTDKCNLTLLETNATPWTINGFPISYCLADQQPSRCTVQFSTTILIVVILSNVLKVICMLYAITRVRDRVLVTISDAIASFLADNCPTTSGKCLLSKKDAQDGPYIKLEGGDVPKKWQRQRHRWFQSVSWKRWFIITILCSLILGSSIYLLRLGIHDDTDEDYPTNLNQFGVETSLTNFGEIVSLPYAFSPPVISLILIANAPQLLVSLAYFQLNAILTLMVANAEWASFASKRKPLRVSSPKGEQRSTYWLQLPYKYSIPLLVIMTTLHWAISQSLFPVRPAFYQKGLEVDILRLSSLGWTSGALLLSIILGGLVFFVCVGFGIFMRYPPGLPLLGGCSLVIAAACHSRSDDKSVELGAVQWGVIGWNEDGTSHCGFTSKEVRMPYEGEICA